MQTQTEQLKGFKSAPTPENTRAIPGAVFHFLAKSDETGGRHALIKIIVQRGAEPPAHTHSREDESYFIIKGSVRYTIGEDQVTVNEGEYVYLPKDLPHSFQVLSDKAEVLMWMSPGGLDQWFWDNSVPAPDGKPLPIPNGPPPPDVIQHFVTSLESYGVKMV
ncbi:MAG TPA: cupin domain-containing protein [Chryseolinea sp.]